MTRTILKDTGIEDLLAVSGGNLDVLQKMTEEFRRRVQECPKKTAADATLLKRPLPTAKYDGDTRASGTAGDEQKSMTTQRAIDVVTEIIQENRENGELEGVLNRHRIAALNHLVRLAEAAKMKAEKPQINR